jgi:homoserine dehydrogenase
MSLKPVKIGICGLGTVGSGTFNVLARNADQVEARAQAVGARRDNPACEVGDTRVSRDIFEVARDPEVDILVELIGGTTTARELTEEAHCQQGPDRGIRQRNFCPGGPARRGRAL